MGVNVNTWRLVQARPVVLPKGCWDLLIYDKLDTFWLQLVDQFYMLNFFSFLFFFYLQRSNRAAVVTPGSHPMANGRVRAFVTETSCTSSACPPLSWWGRRTSPVKRTTSGRPRNPAASVSLSDASCVFGVPAHKYGCSRRRGYGALHNKWPDYPHSWPCILKQWMLLLFN